MGETPSDEIPSYMTQAILATLLCFPFTGTLAIVQASRVRTATDAGDRETALRASRSARRLVWISVWCGLVMVGLTVLAGVAAVLYISLQIQ